MKSNKKTLFNIEARIISLKMLAALSLVAAASLLTACGGGGDTSSAGTSSSSTEVAQRTSATKAEFIKAGDKICEEGIAEANDLFHEYLHKQHKAEPNTPANRIKVTRFAMVPAVVKEGQRLRALDLPADETDQAEAIVAAFEKAGEEGEADPGILLKLKESPAVEAGKLAKSFGFKVCSQYTP